MALDEGLYAALGAIGLLPRPLWAHVGSGPAPEGHAARRESAARRAQSRDLWNALLKGDFARGKALHDQDAAERLLVDAPSDAVLLDCLLLIGGYTGAADKLMARLADKRKGAAGISTREASLLRALRDALDAGNGAGLSVLHGLAGESGRGPAVRQLAIVALYYAYKARRDFDRARATAGAVWAEAESVRRELEAMGVRPLGHDLSLPRPGKAAAKSTVPAREKAAVAAQTAASRGTTTTAYRAESSRRRRRPTHLEVAQRAQFLLGPGGHGADLVQLLRDFIQNSPARLIWFMWVPLVGSDGAAPGWRSRPQYCKC